ncbi:tudor domain-containing protein 5 [Trichonephila clavata]|uniref:Tudor domain-containing protein 5 n=1 Tax=Trichonephila clavata TaxID=2740835 RepID=A0A8X6KKG9_TRICU|nr:tudor domain-containing protein 5 [Trichonephila clavata]
MLGVLKDIAPPSLKYIQPNLPVEIETKFIPVFISAIINPNCFWFQLHTKEAVQRLKSLEKEMENFYNKLSSGMYKIANSDVTVGAICATFCKDDSQWYRTVIAALPTIDDAIVDFVDYGTSERVSRQHLYYLRKSFTHLPAQAFQAELAFIKSANEGGEWDLAAQKRFHDLCNRPYLMAQVNSINNSVASLFLCDSIGEVDIHINDVLVHKGYAEYCASQTSDYESSSELLSDESLSDSSLPSNLLQNEMVTSENNCFFEKANISVNPLAASQGSHHESSQLFCKRVLLDENYFIHILSVRNEAYVSGSDICNLFWANKSEDLLADRLKCKNVIVPTFSVSREDFKDLFEICERYSVKGFHKNLVTLYPLKYAVKILNILGHPSEIARETFIYEMEIFDPSSATWQNLAEESKFEDYICDNGDDIEKLCLYDLKAMQEGFRYKRMKYLENFRKSRDKELFQELKNLDKTQNGVLKQIKEIEKICCAFSDYDCS